MTDEETARRLLRYDMLNVSLGYDPDYRMVEQEEGDWVRYEDHAAALAQARAEERADYQRMADAAEMLWTVVANVSGGDWSQQTQEWQDAAARWRDNYFAAIRRRGEGETR